MSYGEYTYGYRSRIEWATKEILDFQGHTNYILVQGRKREGWRSGIAVFKIIKTGPLAPLRRAEKCASIMFM